jgi:hypothetical protein
MCLYVFVYLAASSFYIAQWSRAMEEVAADIEGGQGEAEVGAEVAGVEGAPPQAAPTRLFRRVYSVGFSHTDGPGRKRPQDYSKEGFAVILQKRHEEFFAANAAADVPVNTVIKIMVFAERHADGHPHYYAVILCARPYRCARVQNRLKEVDRVYTSFGTSHTYFWTAVVYASVPTAHKGPQEMDPEPYHSEGRALREELADIPRAAKAADKDRVLSYLGIPRAGKTSSAPTLSKAELAERIVSERWATTADIVAAAGQTKTTDPALYNTVLNWGAQRVEEFMKWTWELAGGTQRETRSKRDTMTSSRGQKYKRNCCSNRDVYNVSGGFLVPLRRASASASRPGGEIERSRSVWRVCLPGPVGAGGGILAWSSTRGLEVFPGPRCPRLAAGAAQGCERPCHGRAGRRQDLRLQASGEDLPQLPDARPA